MVFMLLCVFICMVIVLLIFNKMFNFNDGLEVLGIIFSLEDLNKLRKYFEFNRLFFFKIYFQVENDNQNCKFEEVDVVQKKKVSYMFSL